ncbi:hypothetical protein BJ742DRAFT_809954 [Cladochytrium replicatum]|nr:hypothetical protein BJ742DRAFT_809954 [Cladochytrium replicatum]
MEPTSTDEAVTTEETSLVSEAPSTSFEESTTSFEEPTTSVEEPTTSVVEETSSSVPGETSMEEPTSTTSEEYPDPISSYTETQTKLTSYEPTYTYTIPMTEEFSSSESTAYSTFIPTRSPRPSPKSPSPRPSPRPSPSPKSPAPEPSPRPPGPLDACDNTLNYFYLAGSCSAVATYYEWMEEEQSLALVPAGITTNKIRGFCEKLPSCLGGKIPKTVKKIYNVCKPCRADYHQIIFLAGSARTWFLLCQRDQNNFYVGDILSWATSFFRTKVFLTPDDIAQLQPAKPRICSGKNVSPKITKSIKLWLEIASEALNNTPLINSAEEVITVYNRLTRGLNTLCGSGHVPVPQDSPRLGPFPQPPVSFP